MKYASLVLLFYCAIGAMAEDVKPVTPCLIVSSVKGVHGTALAAGVFAPAFMHGERFPYVESQGLSVHDVKVQYKQKELEKLEARGIKVVVTNSDLEAARRTCQADEQKGGAH